MADLDDLGYDSITELGADEALEMLRQIRLSRRAVVAKSRTVTAKTKKKETQNVDPAQAAELLKILMGGE